MPEEKQCVIECLVPYQPNSQTLNCDLNIAKEFFTPLVIVIIVLVILSLVLLVISKILSCFEKNIDYSMEQCYAYFSIIEFINRWFILGNLWLTSQIFIFAVCFMALLSTSVFGIFLYYLFIQPILLHSPHFRNLAKKRKFTYFFIQLGTFIIGPNFYRFSYSRVFGTLSTSNDLNKQIYFVQPMNNVAMFTIVLTGIMAGLNIVCLFVFRIGDDIWNLSVLGLLINLTMIIFQIVRCFQVHRFSKKYNIDHANDGL
jgi:hypothetical protein